MPLTKMDLVPGFRHASSQSGAEGGWWKGQWVRFVANYPWKIGGYVTAVSDLLEGKCRRIQSWTDNSERAYAAFGTTTKIYVFSQGTMFDVTPLRDSGTLGADPFTTTLGSPDVVVFQANNGCEDGDTVIFSGASVFNGMDCNGTHIVSRKLDGDNYIITLGTTATATGTGGGAAVAYEYEINIGLDDNIPGHGWGVGPYGEDTYGTPRTTSVTLRSRTWSLDTYGQNLTATYRGGALYEWNPDTGGRMTVIANAPATQNAHFVTEERHIFSIGSDGNGRQIQNSDPDDPTDWTPTIDNQADQRTLQADNPFISGTRVASGLNLIWSSSDVFSVQYLGQEPWFSYRRRGRNAGLVGPNAYAEVEGVVFWMANSHRFLLYDGAVRDVPNMLDIRDYVFDDINHEQQIKTYAEFNSQYNEVWWLYASAGSDECDSYVIYMIDPKRWVFGKLQRTAMEQSESFDQLLMVGPDGRIYSHEEGVDADGAALAANVQSGFLDISDGEHLMDIYGILPDFKKVNGTVSFEVLVRSYLAEDEPEVTRGPFDADSTTGLVEFLAGGRFAATNIASNEIGGDFRLAAMRLDVEEGGML